MSGFKLHCENMSFRYSIRQGHWRRGYHDALTGLSFTLAEGDRLGVVGDNGAGKSTLLRLIAGILYPTSGRIRTDGRPSRALLTLTNRWYPDLNGRDNAILACLMGGIRRREAEKLWPAIAEFSELGEWLDRPIRTYSSGMAVRLALATALQASPDILLLDETLGVGDARFQAKAKAAIADKMERTRCLVLVSHHQNTIRSICNQAIWLERGILKDAGPTAEVLANYQAWIQNGGA
jgi:lipopolysaccharide transport system ATP-binding protein